MSFPLLALPHAGPSDQDDPEAGRVSALRGLLHVSAACVAKRRADARATARALLAQARHHDLTACGWIPQDGRAVILRAAAHAERAAARALVQSYTV